MGARRRAREAALAALYQLDLNPDLTVEQALSHVFETFHDQVGEDPELRGFAIKIVRGVQDQKQAIDEVLARASTHWRLDRMAAIDRNLLRLAAHELLYEHAIPASVSIDEAVEIAKRYGTADSPAFINGVLDRVAEEAREK